MLEESIVRGVLLVMPAGAPNIDKLREVIKKPYDEEQIEWVEKYAYQYAVGYELFVEDWKTMSEIIVLMPFEQDNLNKQLGKFGDQLARMLGSAFTVDGQKLASAFQFLFEMETRMNEICDKMGEADEQQLEEYMEELGTIQDLLTMHDFYMIDSKVEEVGKALGLADMAKSLQKGKKEFHKALLQM